MLSASQEELKAMLQGEERNLLDKRRKLFSEIERVSESYISPNPKENKICLDQIKVFRNEYLNDTVDFISDYKQLLKDPSVLDEWIMEIDDISQKVKELAKDIEAYAVKLASNSNSPAMFNKHHSDKYTMASLLKTELDANSDNSLPKNMLSVKCPETVQPQDSEFDQPALTLVTKPALNADLEHQAGVTVLKSVEGLKTAQQAASPPCAERQDPYEVGRILGATGQDTSLPSAGHVRHQDISQDGEVLHTAWQNHSGLANGDCAGSQDLYQDSGGLTSAWNDLYQVSVGYVKTGLDQHEDSGRFPCS